MYKHLYNIISIKVYRYLGIKTHKTESEIMKMNANINYEKDPFAIVEYLGETANIYPFLSKQEQKRINQNYNEELEISVSQDTIRHGLPNAWKKILQAKRIFRKLPDHIVNRIHNIPVYNFPVTKQEIEDIESHTVSQIEEFEEFLGITS